MNVHAVSARFTKSLDSHGLRGKFLSGFSRIGILVISLVINSVSSAQDDFVVISFASVDQNARLTKIAEKITSNIANKMGVNIELRDIPIKRTIRMLETGEIHADLTRATSFEELLPSAIRVEEPLVSYPLWIFSPIPDLKIDGWSSLEKYRIVTVRGWLYINDKVDGFNTIEVDTPHQALRILAVKRADIFVSDHVTPAGIMNDKSFKSSDIVRLEQPIDFIHEYTYFSAKYPKLADAYNRSLKELKASGVYDKIFEETK